MYESGKCTYVVKDMKNYQLEILGMSETRLTEVGQTKPTTGETIIYSRNKGQTMKNRSK